MLTLEHFINKNFLTNIDAEYILLKFNDFQWVEMFQQIKFFFLCVCVEHSNFKEEGWNIFQETILNKRQEQIVLSDIYG